MLTTSELVALGKNMRESANDRENHMGCPVVPVSESWQFVCDNAGEDSEDMFPCYVPETLPLNAPHAFVVGYYTTETDVDAIVAGIDAYFGVQTASAQAESEAPLARHGFDAHGSYRRMVTA